jgi:hypothetical protein
MPTYAVRFKGMLLRTHPEQLRHRGITHRSKEPSMRIGVIKTGRPIHTVVLEADSEEAARAAVKDALEPDSSSFSDWEAKPA